VITKRTTPLTAAADPHAHEAHDAVAAEAAELESSVMPVMTHQLSQAEQQERDAKFTDGVRTLRVGGASIKLNERILLVLAGIIAPLGLVVVLLGYIGVANTPYVFEQNSYIISGGIFGLALVFLGAFFYFAHWMTQLVKEHRVQSTAMLEAIQRLQDEVARQGEGRPGPDAGIDQRPRPRCRRARRHPARHHGPRPQLCGRGRQVRPPAGGGHGRPHPLQALRTVLTAADALSPPRRRTAGRAPRPR
jgi:hypothetical protein